MNIEKWFMLLGVGIDTPSIDYGPSRDFSTHVYMLEKNIYFLENVGDMSGLPTAGKGNYQNDSNLCFMTDLMFNSCLKIFVFLKVHHT